MKRFVEFTLIWISQNMAIPFWMVGHIHLMTSIYEDIHEIIMNILTKSPVIRIRHIQIAFTTILHQILKERQALKEWEDLSILALEDLSIRKRSNSIWLR